MNSCTRVPRFKSRQKRERKQETREVEMFTFKTFKFQEVQMNFRRNFREGKKLKILTKQIRKLKDETPIENLHFLVLFGESDYTHQRCPTCSPNGWMWFARNDIPKYNMNQFFLSGSTPFPFQGNWSEILYSAIREPLRRFSNCPRSYMTVYVHSLAIPDIHCKLFKNKFSSEMISRKNWENFGVGTYNLPRNFYHLG